MMKFIKNKLKEEKGLTLIELLAVIVILGIIAAIAIPAIGNIIENSRVGAAKSDVLNAISAAELYMADNPDHTGNVVLNDLDPTGDSPTGSSYIDDRGTLQTFEYNPNTRVVATATANAGDLVLTVTGATKEQVAEMPNNTRGGFEGVITVAAPEGT